MSILPYPKHCSTELLIWFTAVPLVPSPRLNSFKVIVGLSVASLTNLLVLMEGFDRWPFLDSFRVVCCTFHLIIDNSTNSARRSWRNAERVPPSGCSCVDYCLLPAAALLINPNAICISKPLNWPVCLLVCFLLSVLLYHIDQLAWQFSE